MSYDGSTLAGAFFVGAPRMTIEKRELYQSAPNGDRWLLVRETESGMAFIEHEPNASSGGAASRIGIGEFLAHGGSGPEHQALLRLIGTLVSQKAE
jgi:hypothetical protein